MRTHYLAKLLLNQSTHSKRIIVIKLLFFAGLSGLTDIITASSAYSHQSLSAGQLEARRYIGVITSTQIKYYQKNHHFADSLEQLNTGIPARTKFYTYTVIPSKVPGVDGATAVNVSAAPLPSRPNLKKVSGATVALPTKGNQFTFSTKSCEAILSSAQGNSYFGIIVSVSSDNSVSLSCHEAYQEVKGDQ